MSYSALANLKHVMAINGNQSANHLHNMIKIFEPKFHKKNPERELRFILMKSYE